MGKAILIFLIPAVFAAVGILIINVSKKPEVVHVPAAYGSGTGYERIPEQYTVTASTHYKWHHGTSAGWKFIVGYILFAAGGFYVYWVDREVKTFSRWVLAFCWLLGLGCIFGKHVFRYYESNTYVRTISAEQYEQNKGDLDAIFQQ